MAERIMIMGESSTGKTTSIRTCNPAETFITQTARKALPFKGWRKSYSYWDATSNPKGNMLLRQTSEEICNVMRYVHSKMSHVKNLIIDDTQYIMAKEYMERAGEKGLRLISPLVVQAA